MSVVSLIIYALLSVGGLTCFKLGAQNEIGLQITNQFLSIKLSWLSILGMAMYVGSFLVYLGMVSKTELSYLTPVTSAVIYLLTAAVSFFVFHESFGLWKSLGLVFILCGIVMMNIRR